jgi:hypothetical protein
MFIVVYTIINLLSIGAFVWFLLGMKKAKEPVNENPWPWLLWMSSYAIETGYMILLKASLIAISINVCYAVMCFIAFWMLFPRKIDRTL